MKKPILLAILLLSAASAAAAYRIEHLEPSSWWVGMQEPMVQLLVHGERIAELEPAVNYPGVSIRGVERTGNPSYLFVNLAIDATTQPGQFLIDFRRNGKIAVTHTYALRARENGSAERRGFGPSDVIYLVTPDRFANGDPGNDTVAGMKEGVNRKKTGGRHGGDLQGLREHLDYVAQMGFTQIWLNPILENNQPEYSYHGYAITNFYRIDPRFGDNELYRKLAQEARARDIGMIMDIVLNHCGSEHWWIRDPPTTDWINNGGKFKPTTHIRETLQDPHAADADRRNFTDGWFVPTMPDLNQRNPLFARYLIQNTLWWIEYAGLSGLRIDTWSYSDRDFLARWTQAVLREYPNLNIVGEEWSLNPAIVSNWQRGKVRADGYTTYLPSLFDFPLQNAVATGLAEQDGWTTGLPRIYFSLANDFLYPAPANIVVFPENHDMNRIYTQLNERFDLYKLTMVLFATTRGIPQYYYGSELLMTSPKERDDGAIRADFPGGWSGDSANGFTGAGLTTKQREAQDFVRQLLNWRKTASAVHDGKLTQYAPTDGYYAYFRENDRQKLMFVINNADQPRRIDPARFQESIRKSTRATDIPSGRQFELDIPFDVPAHGFAAFELRERTPSAATGASAATPALPGVTGTLNHYEQFASRNVDPRNVDVWLPPSYDEDESKRHPVLYMHDGQNLFDPALSYTKIDWGIDETMTRLIGEGAVREAIVVGIWNTPKRFPEYMPKKPLGGKKLTGDLLSHESVDPEQLLSDNYLRFLVEELKPFIDSKYRTLPGRDDTFIMGSSMGGLISAYAISEYPNVFGGAGCVSTHWPIGEGIVIDYLEQKLPKAPGHKLYFDHGTLMVDQYYEPYQKRMDNVMRKLGYKEGVDFLSRKYEGAEHDEAAWRSRVEVPLRFLLGPPGPRRP